MRAPSGPAAPTTTTIPKPTSTSARSATSSVAGKFQEAEKLVDEHFFGVPAAQQAYQPLGDLLLSFDGERAATDYRRELDLQTGIATVSYRVGDAVLTREVFVSYPDRVLVVRLTADKPGRVSVQARFQSPYRGQGGRPGPTRW